MSHADFSPHKRKVGGGLTITLRRFDRKIPLSDGKNSHASLFFIGWWEGKIKSARATTILLSPDEILHLWRRSSRCREQNTQPPRRVKLYSTCYTPADVGEPAIPSLRMRRESSLSRPRARRECSLLYSLERVVVRMCRVNTRVTIALLRPTSVVVAPASDVGRGVGAHMIRIPGQS